MMKLKKLVAIVIAGLLCFSTLVFAEDYEIEVTLNGTPIEFDVKPQLINERTMVPLRAISESFGINVEWIAESMAVRLTTAE